ncbi:MAG: hypothetical protein WAW73_11875 [Rhodoferax sp.]
MNKHLGPWSNSGLPLARAAGMVIALGTTLASCGGGGGTTTGGTPPPAPDTPSFSWVSPQDAAPVKFLCGNTDGDATQARYPKSPVEFPASVTKLVALPDGGLLGATSTTTSSYFKIDSQGSRTAFTPRAVDQLRVDTEGKLWWTDANNVLWRGALQADGKDERIGSIADFFGVPTDGPSESATLGPIKDFAAVPGAVYLAMSDSSASRYYLRRLTRNANGGWQVSTMALPDSVTAGGDSIQIRSNPNGLLALLSTHASPVGADHKQDVTLTYWQLVANNAWQSRASKSYQILNNTAPLYSLNLDSVALDNAGNLIWGGGGNGRLYQMGQDGSWSMLSSPTTANATGLGQDGGLDAVSALSAYSLVTRADGSTVFYDGTTCQVRRLTSTAMTTVSGPRYANRTHFADASLLGFDSQGNLVFSHELGNLAPPTPLVSRYNIGQASFATMEGVGTLTSSSDWVIANVGSDACYQNNCGSFSWRLPSLGNGRFLDIDSATDTLYAKDAYGKLFRSGSSGYVAIVNSPPSFPTAFDGPRTPGIAGAHFPYFVGVVADIYSWPVALRLNVPGDTFSVVAGGSVASDLFPGKTPSYYGFYLQARSDGGFWYAAPTGVARIDKSGNSTEVAGCAKFSKMCPISSGTVDGQGSSANFWSITRIRVLPDNRLLVLDKNAVRLVDDAGNVRTLFTLATTGLPGSNFVDMIPRGRDVYLTLDDQPRLALARNVLP